MHALWRDLKHAIRRLRRTPGFALVVILTLGLGVGANAAIFSLMDQVLIRPLPVHHPSELVLLDGPGAFQGRTFNNQTFSYPMYKDFRDRNEVFSGVLARFPMEMAIVWKGQSERVDGELVTGNYFEVLGVMPVVGRLFNAADDRTPGAHPVVVLSHGYWLRRFGGDPAVVNQTIVVNGHAMTIVGVSQPGFAGVQVGRSADVVVPMMMKAEMTPTWNDLDNRRSRWLTVMGRRRPWRLHRAGRVADERRLPPDQRTGDQGHQERLRHVPPAFRGKASRRPRWREGPVRSAPAVLDSADRADVHGGRRAADRVRQRREPAARARDVAAAGDCAPPRARREPIAHRVGAIRREPRAGDRRRRGRTGARRLDRQDAAGDAARRWCLDADGDARSPCRRLHPRAVAVDGAGLRHRARTGRDPGGGDVGAEGRRRKRRGWRPSGEVAARARRRAGRDVDAAARRRRPVRAQSLQPAWREPWLRRRTSARLQHRSVAEWLQPGAQPVALRANPAGDCRDPRSPRRVDVGDRCAHRQSVGHDGEGRGLHAQGRRRHEPERGRRRHTLLLDDGHSARRGDENSPRRTRSGAPKVAIINETMAHYFYGDGNPIGRRIGFGRDADTRSRSWAS